MKQIILILITAAIYLPVVSFAGVPMVFDNWSVNTGVISTDCASGFICGSGLTDRGLFQRSIEETSTNRKYFQTIVTESDQSGIAGSDTLSFSNESFTAIGRDMYGLANKQYIFETKETTDHFLFLKHFDVDEKSIPSSNDVITFDSDSTTLTGWATSRGRGSDVEFDFSQIIAMSLSEGIMGDNITYNLRQRVADTSGTLNSALTLTDPVFYNSGDFIKAAWYSHIAEGKTFGWMTYEKNAYVSSDYWALNPYSFIPYENSEMYDFASSPQIEDPFNTTL